MPERERNNKPLELTDEELRAMFEDWSGGQGYIDMKTLFNAVRQSKVPVSEHQLMEFFYRCDVNEDGKIDFIEFEVCHIAYTFVSFFLLFKYIQIEYSFTTKQIKHFIQQEEHAIRHIFEELDIDNAGKVNTERLKEAMHANAARLRMDEKTLDDWVDTVSQALPETSAIDNSFRMTITLSATLSLLTITIVAMVTISI
ncbi:hypothetical protein RFI_26652, partial [Reticulomyxa filosa]